VHSWRPEAAPDWDYPFAWAGVGRKL